MNKSIIVAALLLFGSVVSYGQSPNGAYSSPPIGGSGTAVATVAGSSPITSTGTTAITIACPTCTTSAAAITNNVLAKGSGGAQGITNSLATDDGTTLTYAGTGGVSAPKLISTVATGTAPLTVTSTTVVPNLNVAQLNGATFASPGSIGGSTPNSINTTSILNQAKTLFAGGAPTIVTGTGASIATNNGSGGFTVNVGTGGLSSIVIGFSGTSVNAGWICSANDRTTHSATVFQTVQTNSVLSTTQCTISNITSAGATGTAWTNSDLISVQATAD